MRSESLDGLSRLQCPVSHVPCPVSISLPVVPGGAHSITGHLPSELVKLVARPSLQEQRAVDCAARWMLPSLSHFQGAVVRTVGVRPWRLASDDSRPDLQSSNPGPDAS